MCGSCEGRTGVFRTRTERSRGPSGVPPHQGILCWDERTSQRYWNAHATRGFLKGVCGLLIADRFRPNIKCTEFVGTPQAQFFASRIAVTPAARSPSGVNAPQRASIYPALLSVRRSVSGVA